MDLAQVLKVKAALEKNSQQVPGAFPQALPYAMPGRVKRQVGLPGGSVGTVGKGVGPSTAAGVPKGMGQAGPKSPAQGASTGLKTAEPMVPKMKPLLGGMKPVRPNMTISQPPAPSSDPGIRLAAVKSAIFGLSKEEKNRAARKGYLAVRKNMIVLGQNVQIPDSTLKQWDREFERESPKLLGMESGWNFHSDQFNGWLKTPEGDKWNDAQAAAFNKKGGLNMVPPAAKTLSEVRAASAYPDAAGCMAALGYGPEIAVNRLLSKEGSIRCVEETVEALELLEKTADADVRLAALIRLAELRKEAIFRAALRAVAPVAGRLLRSKVTWGAGAVGAGGYGLGKLFKSTADMATGIKEKRENAVPSIP